MGDLIAAIFYLVPLFILAFIVRWIRHIKINSEIHVEQNKEMIRLLQEIEKKC
ncbi:hypothetical protein [Ureibacillus sinduriensis]|uniref:hypothetical protein n=1 Tax=Ureibacillus sinduriensis TaxID=561440 RepID=UPI000AF3840F|nr:hypothetical protein [Ureibacillus sinduriensis]